MSTAEATYATHFYEPYIQVEALGRGKELPFDCSTAGFRCVIEAS